MRVFFARKLKITLVEGNFEISVSFDGDDQILYRWFLLTFDSLMRFSSSNYTALSHLSLSLCFLDLYIHR